MKNKFRLFSLLFALLLIFSFCGIAESIDFSSMSVTELINLRENLNNALETRLAKEQEKIILLDDPNGLTVYLSGKTTADVGKSLKVEYVVVNNGSTSQSCHYYTEAVDGWVSRRWNTVADELAPGKKAKNTMNFYDEEYIESWDAPFTLEFTLNSEATPMSKGEVLGIYKIVYSQGILSLVNE